MDPNILGGCRTRFLDQVATLVGNGRMDKRDQYKGR